MKRTRSIAQIVLLTGVLIAIPVASFAYGLTGAGGRLGVLEPENGDDALAISGHLEFAEPSTPWQIMPALMFWDSDRLSGLSMNLDMVYPFQPQGTATPYAGAGVGINHFDREGPGGESTRLGLNLLGGIRFPAGSSQLFVEGRYTASQFSQISVLGGVTFHVHP